MTSHVDAEILALSAEGLLDPDEEGSVQEHLAGCDECGEQLNALAAVSRTLGEVPAPPLPDEVAVRISDAVQAEAEHRREQPSTEPEPSRPDGGSGGGAPIPLHRPKGPKHWMPYLVAAAAAVFVIGGAGAVVQGMFFDDDPVESTSEDAENDSPDAALAYQPVMLNSDVEYTEEELDTQAAEVLGSVSPDALRAAPESDAEGPEDSSHPNTSEAPSDISSCVHKLGSTNGAQQPALIDIGSFQPGEGGPAEDAWVMYYGSEPEDEFDVVVVSPRCADTGSAEDTVLAETTVVGL